MKLSSLMNSDTFNCIWILVIPIGIIEFSTHVNEVFEFISVSYTITDLQPPENLSTYLVGGNGGMRKTSFSPPQNAKEGNQLKHKIEVGYRHLLTVRFWVRRSILVIPWWAHKRQTFISISKKYWEFRNFF